MLTAPATALAPTDVSNRCAIAGVIGCLPVSSRDTNPGLRSTSSANWRSVSPRTLRAERNAVPSVPPGFTDAAPSAASRRSATSSESPRWPRSMRKRWAGLSPTKAASHRTLRPRRSRSSRILEPSSCWTGCLVGWPGTGGGVAMFAIVFAAVPGRPASPSGAPGLGTRWLMLGSVGSQRTTYPATPQTRDWLGPTVNRAPTT